MALKIYKNKKTNEIKRSLKSLDLTDWEELIVAPNQKLMVAANKATGTSKLKDSEKILRERSRNYSRDKEIDNDIQFNKINKMDEKVARNLLNEKGERRRKIDDI